MVRAMGGGRGALAGPVRARSRAAGVRGAEWSVDVRARALALAMARADGWMDGSADVCHARVEDGGLPPTWVVCAKDRIRMRIRACECARWTWKEKGRRAQEGRMCVLRFAARESELIRVCMLSFFLPPASFLSPSEMLDSPPFFFSLCSRRRRRRRRSLRTWPSARRSRRASWSLAWRTSLRRSTTPSST